MLIRVDTSGAVAQPVSTLRFHRVRHGGNNVWAAELSPQVLADAFAAASPAPYAENGVEQDYVFEAVDGETKKPDESFVPAGDVELTVTSTTAPNPTVDPETIDPGDFVGGVATVGLTIAHDGVETHIITLTATDPATGRTISMDIPVGPDLTEIAAGETKVFRSSQTMTASEEDWDTGGHPEDNFAALQRASQKGLLADGELEVPTGLGENEKSPNNLSIPAAERYVREKDDTFDGLSRSTAGRTAFDLSGYSATAAKVWVKCRAFARQKKLDGTYAWSPDAYRQIVALKAGEDADEATTGAEIRDIIYSDADAELRGLDANVACIAHGGTPDQPDEGDGFVWIELPAAVVNGMVGDTLYLWSYIKGPWLLYADDLFKNADPDTGEGFNQIFFAPLALVIADAVEYTTDIIATGLSWQGYDDGSGADPVVTADPAVMYSNFVGPAAPASAYEEGRFGMHFPATEILGTVLGLKLWLTRKASEFGNDTGVDWYFGLWKGGVFDAPIDVEEWDEITGAFLLRRTDAELLALPVATELTLPLLADGDPTFDQTGSLATDLGILFDEPVGVPFDPDDYVPGLEVSIGYYGSSEATTSWRPRLEVSRKNY